MLAVQRTDDATLLTIQTSSPQAGVRLGPRAFNDLPVASLEFFDRFALEDTSNGIRNRPLSWLRPDETNLDPADGPPNSCICPYRGSSFTLSPEPPVFETLYGPLPEDGATVTLTAPGGLAIPDLTVQPADG